MAKKALLPLYILVIVITILLVSLLFLIPGKKQPEERASGRALPSTGRSVSEPIPGKAGEADRTHPTPGTGTKGDRMQPIPGKADEGGQSNQRAGHGPEADRTQEPVGEHRPPANVEQHSASATRPDDRPSKELPAMYVIIDDVGYNLEVIEPFLKIPAPIAFSVLPGLPYTREASRIIREAGREVMLHLPMEAGKGENPGPGAIYSHMEEQDIIDLLDKHISRLPGIVGVNNHMGSRITADEQIMETVLSFLSERELLFIDSLTTSQSAVKAVAKTLDFPYLSRDVFLDNQREAEAVEKAVAEGIRIAKQKGRVVMIGHIQTPSLPDVLTHTVSLAEELGVKIEPISQLAREYDYSYPKKAKVSDARTGN